MPIDHKGGIMDKFVKGLKSIFIKSDYSTLLREDDSNTQPKVSAKPNSDGKTSTNSPGSKDQSGAGAQPAMTKSPQMSSSSAGKLQPLHDAISFQQAVRNGNVEEVQKHLQAGANAGAAFNEAVISNNEELVKLLLPKVSEADKGQALEYLISKAKEYAHMDVPVAIGSLILSQSENQFRFHAAISRAYDRCEEDEVAHQAVMTLRHRIETGALCNIVASGNLRTVSAHLYEAASPDIVNTAPTSGAPGPLAIAASNKRLDIVKRLLPMASEESKIAALVALASVASEDYSTDSYVPTGHALFQSLKNPEQSFAEVRSQIEEKYSDVSSMAPAFLNDISRN
jgi:hypothetical protein